MTPPPFWHSQISTELGFATLAPPTRSAIDANANLKRTPQRSSVNLIFARKNCTTEEGCTPKIGAIAPTAGDTENAPHRAAPFFVASRPSEGEVEAAFVYLTLAQCLGLHHLRADRRTASDRRNVATTRERTPSVPRPAYQHDGGVLADRIERDRFGKLGHGLAHDVDRLRLKPADASLRQARLFHPERAKSRRSISDQSTRRWPPLLELWMTLEEALQVGADPRSKL
jgi:hypothetical protein